MQKNEHDLVNEAQACLETGDLEGARWRLENICHSDENDVEAWLSLASVNAQLGVFGEVERCCRHVIDRHPDNVNANYNLGLALQMQEDSKSAIGFLERATQLSPGFTDAQYYLGLAYGAEGNLDKAIGALKYVLCVQPNNAGVHYELGMLHARKEEYGQAADCFHQAVEIEPELVKAHYNLGSALFALEKYKKAAECFWQVMQMESGHVEACRNLAKILEKVGELDQAIVYYERLCALAPDDAGAHTGLGRVYLANRQLQDAETEFSWVIEHEADNHEGYLGLGQVYSELGESDKAAKCFEEALRCNPESHIAGHFLAGQKGEKDVGAAQQKYVEKLFDGYADRFDRELVENLEYKTPGLLRDLVDESLAQPDRKWDVLDIGCGTGLSGEVFRDMARTLTGIDLSSKMIDKAGKRGIYDKLVVGELSSEMGSMGENFDLVLSADVFVYIGDLDNVFSTCAAILKQGGYFVFSTEATTGTNYILRSSGRYVHSVEYINKTASSHGFAVDAVRNCNLRLEMNKPVEGNLYLLHRM